MGVGKRQGPANLFHQVVQPLWQVCLAPHLIVPRPRLRARVTTSACVGSGGVSLRLQHLATTVETGGADVVAQVHLTRGGFHGGAGGDQSVVRAVHATLGGRLLVLLNGHVGLRGNFARDLLRTSPAAGCRERRSGLR